MTQYQESRLTAFEHIVRWDMYLTSTEYGWDLRVTHAHVGGMLGDCEPDRYTALTTDELFDVLTTSVDAGGHCT